jgi:uncharacterized metal-binding protein
MSVHTLRGRCYVPVAMTRKKPLPDCARCDLERPEMACMNAKGRGAKGCVTLVRRDLVAEASALYAGRDLELARAASVQEGSGYRREGAEPAACKTRLQETWEYAERIGARRIGLAYCVGLRREASLVAGMLAALYTSHSYYAGLRTS